MVLTLDYHNAEEEAKVKIAEQSGRILSMVDGGLEGEIQDESDRDIEEIP